VFLNKQGHRNDIVKEPSEWLTSNTTSPSKDSTNIVEALRLGCKVIGVDLNPVAWFVTKKEIEPVPGRQPAR